MQCVARGKPFKLRWPLEWIRQIPGFPQYPASCARTKGIPWYLFLWHYTLCARPRSRGNINIRSVFWPLMNTAMSTANTHRAQRKKTAAQQHHQQVTTCVRGTSICAVLLWLVDFFGACSASCARTKGIPRTLFMVLYPLRAYQTQR